jgi:DNA-binding MarR family transcriptional regulator
VTLAEFSTSKNFDGSPVGAEQVAVRVMDTAPVIMHFIRSKLKERANTHASVPQLRMLGFIDKHPGCSLTPLSDFLGIASASASTMIDRLVRSGLVARDVDPLKRRNLVLHLTAQGKEELLTARSVAIQKLSECMVELPTEQLEKIDQSLNLLKAAFESVYGSIDNNGNTSSDSARGAGPTLF